MINAKNVFGKVYYWAEERLIIEQTHDKNGFVCNLLSELKEYQDSVSADGKIDSLCDTVAFCVTELPKLGLSVDDLEDMYQRILDRKTIFIRSHPEYMIDVLGSIVDADKASVSVIEDIIKECFYRINLMGYYIQESMEETFKEINSRKGAWDDEAKKWKKYTDEYHKSLWVSANYETCKHS